MMRLKKLFLLFVCCSTLFMGCSSDDDEVVVIPPRDRGEQAIADEEALLAYLGTHFYNYEDFQNPPADFDYIIRFDTIAGANADKIPLIESDLLSVKTVQRDEIDYNLYILKIREGAESGYKPTYADSTYIAYQGELTDQTVFDSNTVSPVWFDLPGYVGLNNQGRPVRIGGTISGFMEAIVEFREGTGFTINPDNTVNWINDYGIGAAFIPSGIAYFNSPPSPSIPLYSPLIFSFKLLRAVEADHDNDGIPSHMEDLNGDGNLFNDDTDGNGFPNHSDADDDGDGTPTREEIIINEDGTIEFPDSNGNGIPDYLDPDTF